MVPVPVPAPSGVPTLPALPGGGLPVAAARTPHPGPTPYQELVGLMRGFVVAKSLYAAARLGVADLLAAGPRSVADLAAATGANPAALRRLLRALSSIEAFDETAPDSFALGRLGRALTSTAPDSAHHWLLLNGGAIYRAFDEIVTSVRTGRPGFGAVFGSDFFDAMAGDPQLRAEFDGAMTAATGLTARHVLQLWDLTGVRTVVDVGGGNGTFVAALLDAHPALTGVVFDRPEVAAAAGTAAVTTAYGSRCSLVAGDFLTTVPAGADLYVLSWVLHDWADDDAVRILRACRRAIPPTGRLLVVEAVRPDVARPHPAQFGDIVMLVALGGQERTAAEYRELLARADFCLTEILPTTSARSLLQAVPV
jgi:SAM-dependent methyltransferase